MHPGQGCKCSGTHQDVKTTRWGNPNGPVTGAGKWGNTARGKEQLNVQNESYFKSPLPLPLQTGLPSLQDAARQYAKIRPECTPERIQEFYRSRQIPNPM